MRLMVTLLRPKHTYNLSDEKLVVALPERLYHQFFGSGEHCQPRAPCDSTLNSKFRKLSGEKSAQEMFEKIVTVAV